MLFWGEHITSVQVTKFTKPLQTKVIPIRGIVRGTYQLAILPINGWQIAPTKYRTETNSAVSDAVTRRSSAILTKAFATTEELMGLSVTPNNKALTKPAGNGVSSFDRDAQAPSELSITQRSQNF